MRPLRRNTVRLLVVTSFALLCIASVTFLRDHLQHLPVVQPGQRLERRPRLEGADWDAVLKESEDHVLAELHGQQQQQQQLDQNNTIQPLPARQGQQQHRNKYHVVVSSDARVYNEWQVRICYYWYTKVKEQWPGSSMGGFTRLLHTGQPDMLMDEIPTAVVNSLPDEVTQGYPVLSRPAAFRQFVEQYLPNLPEDYVLMCEPDHIFVRPPPIWATPTKPAAYPFTYIIPKDHKEELEPFNKRKVDFSAMAQIGNSPVMMHRSQMQEVVPLWAQLSLDMHSHQKAKKLGWILDMYAFSLACSQASTGPIQVELHYDFMLQPPFEDKFNMPAAGGRPGHIIHYTYGQDFDEGGKQLWGQVGTGYHFDKRDYSNAYPPSNIPAPPAAVKNGVVHDLIRRINEATANIRPWKQMNPR